MVKLFFVDCDLSDMEAVARICYHSAKPIYTLMGHKVPEWGDNEFTKQHRSAMIHRCSSIMDGQSLEQAHSEWVNRLINKGWKVGEERSYINKTHPHLKPFNKMTDYDKVGHSVVHCIMLFLLGKISNTKLFKEILRQLFIVYEKDYAINSSGVQTLEGTQKRLPSNDVYDEILNIALTVYKEAFDGAISIKV